MMLPSILPLNFQNGDGQGARRLYRSAYQMLTRSLGAR